ncbi:MAG: glycosyltransferase family 4 protein [Actinomycetales bacterium]
MRIAHLTDCYLPRLGGIEVQVHDVATRQRAAGHDVLVLTATPGPEGERHGVVDVVDGVPVHRLAARMPFQLPVNPRAPKAIRRILTEAGVDVAHVHAGVVSPFAVDAARVTVAMGLPTVVTWHCLLGPAELAFRAADRMTSWAQAPVALTAVSDVAAAPIRRIAGARVEVSVLPNGIDPSLWQVQAAPRVPGRVEVVTTMRLAPRKRPLPLLRMMHAVRRLVPDSVDLRLSVIGDGPVLSQMRRYLERHDMTPWVTLHGRLTRTEIRELYRSADLYVAPAELESFGIAALEARTAGLPVVAKAVSGIREFVHDGQEGLLAGTDSEMVDALVRLATDHGLRAGIAAHNAAVEPAQSWPLVLARAEAEYKRAMEIADG